MVKNQILTGSNLVPGGNLSGQKNAILASQWLKKARKRHSVVKNRPNLNGSLGGRMPDLNGNKSQTKNQLRFPVSTQRARSAETCFSGSMMLQLATETFGPIGHILVYLCSSSNTFPWSGSRSRKGKSAGTGPAINMAWLSSLS